MMINSFDNYLKQGKVKKKTPDLEEAKALIDKSENRLHYTKLKKIEARTSAFVLEDSYEAMREAAQALMSIKGFKPYSHEATISFIREFYNSKFEELELRKFDRFRQLRNDSVYQAKLVSEEDAKSCLSFAVHMIAKIKIIVKK